MHSEEPYLTMYLGMTLCFIFCCLNMRRKEGLLMNVVSAAGCILSLFVISRTFIHQHIPNSVSQDSILLVPAIIIALVFAGYIAYSRLSEKRKQAKAGAKKLFPYALQDELNHIIKKNIQGVSFGEFSWDGVRIVWGDGANARVINGNGRWIRIHVSPKPYIYEAYATALRARFAAIGVILSAEDMHTLSSLMHFNWRVSGQRIEGAFLAIVMVRRGEYRRLRCALEGVEVSAQAG